MNNPDHIFQSLETIGFLGVKILKFFVADPGSGMETVRIRDPGWKKVGSGNRDKHPGSATLDPTNLINVNACPNLNSIRSNCRGIRILN